MGIRELQDEFAEGLINDTLDVTLDITEVGLDSILENGIVKEIPVIRTIASVCKVGLNIKDRYFAKKIIKFIYEFKNEQISEDKLEEFKINMNSEDYREKVTERLIVILDRIEEINRTLFLSKLFKGFIEEKISWSDFCKFSKYIDFLENDDFELLSFIDENEDNRVCISTTDKQELEGCANKLMQFNLVDFKLYYSMVFGIAPVTIFHSLTNNGKRFVSCFK